MDSFVPGARKRNLSSDTTDSSDNEANEGEGASPTYNLYGLNDRRSNQGHVAAKYTRQLGIALNAHYPS